MLAFASKKPSHCTFASIIGYKKLTQKQTIAVSDFDDCIDSLTVVAILSLLMLSEIIQKSK